ncbi:hypothetical protein ACWN8K_08865 [Pseudolactococcus piscium]
MPPPNIDRLAPSDSPVLGNAGLFTFFDGFSGIPLSPLIILFVVLLVLSRPVVGSLGDSLAMT